MEGSGWFNRYEGCGLMISGLTSREFGFGFPISPDDLTRINQNQANKNYIDENAAWEKRGQIMKQLLMNSPFVIEFEYGNAGRAFGYWDYNHMVLQLEDCVDCVKTLYSQFDFLFLFDHSSGHDKQRLD